MKSIIIISHALGIGGAERALLGLLESIDYTKYKVDLFLMRHEGELLNLLPDQVNLLPQIKQYTGLAVPITSVISKGMFGIVAGRVYAKLKAKNYLHKNRVKGDSAVELEYSHKYTCGFVPNISEKQYDLAISFLTPHYFAVEKVKARKRIAWIHTDYSYLNIDIDSERKMWGKYDYIASISKECTKGFISKFPDLNNKIVLIENIVSPTFIRKQAEMRNVEREMKSDDSIKILSVGRFSVQKNFDNVPEICSRIKQLGVSVKWYLIGFGAEKELIQKKIKEFGMEEHVIILGKKNNPYPYIKNCDVYVQPSRYEGKCVAVREAQILGKPVIITDYPTASSQLENDMDGVVVPLDNEGCAIGIAELLLDKEKIQRLKENVKAIDYSNMNEISKVYLLMD